MEKDPIICTCLEIKQSQIENVIKEKNLQSVEEVQNETEAGTVCGGCVDDIFVIIEKIQGKVKL